MTNKNMYAEIEAIEKRLKKIFPEFRGFLLAINLSPKGKILYTRGDIKGLKSMVRRLEG